MVNKPKFETYHLTSMTELFAAPCHTQAAAALERSADMLALPTVSEYILSCDLQGFGPNAE